MNTHGFFRRLWPPRSEKKTPPCWPVPSAKQPITDTPLVVFDLETTGLNQRKDQVISIGAVKILPAGLPMRSSFYELLNIPLDKYPRDGQLIHGLTQHDLQQGKDPATALESFLHYAQNHLWFAFHAEFDRHMLSRAVQQYLGVHYDPAPIDIALLAPLLNPGHNGLIYLDDWLNHFGLDNSTRHNALGDALATAELLLILKQQALRAGYHSWAEVLLAAQRHQKLGQQQNTALLMF
ncbi:MAG TPA: 3'-5' exonuclease [Paenalcaligenes sp.]|nr:3'-5' exonuclease [Paenalcaligenes sp.]